MVDEVKYKQTGKLILQIQLLLSHLLHKRHQMKLLTVFQEFVIDTIGFYRDYFRKTYPAALIFTLFAVIGGCLLLLQLPEHEGDSIRKYGFITLIFRCLSSGSNYYYIDLYKTVYMVFTALFVTGFIKAKDRGTLNFIGIVKWIDSTDIQNTVIAILVMAGFDFLLFYAVSNLSYHTNLDKWMYYVLFFLRILLPIAVFSIAVTMSLFRDKFKLTFKYFFILLACCWAYHEFMYSVILTLKELVVNLVLLPFVRDDTRFLLEIFISIPVLALFMLGFAGLMCYLPMISETVQLNEESEEGTEESDIQVN
jgi:hypothetical protein